MKIAEVTKTKLKRFRVVYRYPGQSHIVHGNFLFVDAADVKDARAKAKEKFTTMYGPTPSIAWAEEAD